MRSGAITLADGRRLSWHEFGDPDGAPVIYTAGTPVSGLAGGSYRNAPALNATTTSATTAVTRSCP